MIYDVAIIGGATAGLSAALTLGRFNKTTIVFDNGKHRNRFARIAHNIFTRDGTPPSKLLSIARKQLATYDTVSTIRSFIQNVKKGNGSFIISTGTGEKYRARKIILATGVTDVLPDIPGIKELWGTKVIYCPFCDGWEMRNMPMALMMNGHALESTLPLLSTLHRDLVILSDGPPDISPVFSKWLKHKKMRIHTEKISQINDKNDAVEILLVNGKRIQTRAMYIKPDVQFNNQLAINLGCVLAPEGSVEVDQHFQTSVEGVYAIGDLSTPRLHQVIFAASSGTKAAMACLNELVKQDLLSLKNDRN